MILWGSKRVGETGQAEGREMQDQTAKGGRDMDTGR